jgi:hypothetical protein
MSAPRIAVLERNRAVLQRSARIVSATAGLVPVAAGDDPEQVRAQLAPDAQLMLCDAVDADLALEWSTRLYPGMKLAFWNAGEMPPLCTRIARHAQIVSLLGWPSFQSMPRPWEIGLVTRNVLDPGRDPTHVAEVFANPPHTAKFRLGVRPRNDFGSPRGRPSASRCGQAPGEAGREGTRATATAPAHSGLPGAVVAPPTGFFESVPDPTRRSRVSGSRSRVETPLRVRLSRPGRTAVGRRCPSPRPSPPAPRPAPVHSRRLQPTPGPVHARRPRRPGDRRHSDEIPRHHRRDVYTL